MENETTVLEPAYREEFQEIFKNSNNITENARNYTLINSGSYKVTVNNYPLMPGENLVIDTDGILGERLVIGFHGSNLFSKLPAGQTLCIDGKRLGILSTIKFGYKRKTYKIYG